MQVPYQGIYAGADLKWPILNPRRRKRKRFDMICWTTRLSPTQHDVDCGLVYLYSFYTCKAPQVHNHHDKTINVDPILPRKP